MTDAAIDHVFKLLDEWRHLPAFRLEPAAAPFFGLFLTDVLEAHYKGKGIKFRRKIIPEFPLKKSQGNSSNKSDFFVSDKYGTSAYLVEIKTDMRSLDLDQISYYSVASSTRLCEILHGLKSIAKNTKARGEQQTRQNRPKVRLLATSNSCTGVHRFVRISC